MGKKNTSVVRKSQVEVIPAAYTVETNANGDKVYKPTAKFLQTSKDYISDVGSAFLTMEEKIARKVEVALTLTEVYDLWKGGDSKKGVPMFVHLFYDSTVPDSYGAAGSEVRNKCNASVYFRGVETLTRLGHKQMKLDKQNAALLAAGIDPKNTKQLQEHNKEERETKETSENKAFSLCMVNFFENGVNENTIGLLVCNVLKKREKEDPNQPNKRGKALIDAAVKALFIAQGKTPTPPAPQPSNLMEELKKAVKSGDNVKAAKAAKAKK